MMCYLRYYDLTRAVGNQVDPVGENPVGRSRFDRLRAQGGFALPKLRWPSLGGILAWTSALKDGQKFDVPDFRKEASRTPCENDLWSPWPEDAGPGQLPPSILGTPKPTRQGLALARKVWKEIGYRE